MRTPAGENHIRKGFGEGAAICLAVAALVIIYICAELWILVEEVRGAGGTNQSSPHQMGLALIGWNF